MKIDEIEFLVVEDDAFQRNMFVTMLRSLGATTIAEAGNGIEALEAIRRGAAEQAFLIVLCDLSMPKMDGLEFLRHLAKERQSVAVVIISALDNRMISAAGSMARMLGIKLLGSIEKPVSIAKLKDLLAIPQPLVNKPQPPVIKRNFTNDEILRGILERQFVPFFQPKVCLKTGRLTGAEALARWIHPEHGVIGPIEFISLLEQSGDIDKLTFSMLEQSFLACRSFHDKGHFLNISVNLSLVSLGDSELGAKITDVMSRAGIEPKYITLEITESAAMTNVAQALETLTRLCMNGFVLSIDDYGTGYSSMQQITRLPFGELKIDQTFVKGFSENEALHIVVESSVGMAHKLQIKCVAEGVETQQDWDTLQLLGCDTAQGYFIAKPMELAAFHDFMAHYKPKTSIVSPALRDLQKLNILAIDDDGYTRQLVWRALHNLGFTSITVTDSAESAVKMLEAKAYDLIITDFLMTGMNGLELARLVRSGKTHAKRETRIMMLTSFSKAEVLGAALALDINGFLVKPPIPSELDEKIRKAMTERLYLHPAIAYEAIQYSEMDQPGTDPRPTDTRIGPAIILDKHQVAEGSQGGDVSYLGLHELKPGMKLMSDVRFSEGKLLLSHGHQLTELWINRLFDLADVLQTERFVIQSVTENV